MAFTPFYLDKNASGASDLNSGSTTAAPTHTYAGGTFVRATGVYTVASGNPSTDGFVAAGDYVSIYTTVGRTIATFIAKVASVTATTIVTDTTIVYGLNTTVSETANASTLTIGGSWVSELPLAATAAAGGLGTFTIPQSTKINIKAATYTITSSRTIAMAGTTTAPLWISGYNTTPGDLDADTANSLSKPILAQNATFTLTVNGAHNTWSSLSITGNRSGTIFSQGGASFFAVRVRFENTSSNAAAIACTLTTNTGSLAYCWFKCPTTATTTGTASVGGHAVCVGCVFEGGGKAGANLIGTSNNIFDHCIFLNNTGEGILYPAPNTGLISYCTFYNPTQSGIKFTGVSGSTCGVVGCLFSNCGANGINQSSGTNTNTIFRACNDFYLCSGGNENGFGDSPDWFRKTESGSPVTSATDMTPLLAANAYLNGFPKVFEGGGALGSQINGGVSIGAVQPTPAASSGGGAVAIFGGN